VIFFSTVKHGMLFDILEEQLRIEFLGKVAKKDISEWLHDCRQLQMVIKGAIIVPFNEY
jgi:hypothetical protein